MTSHIYIHICVTSRIHICDMMCMTWVIHMCNTCNVYDMSHSHVTHLWQESFTCDLSVTWVMHMWLICVRHESCRTHQVTDMNATYMNVDTDINVDICDMMCTTWVIHMCNMARVSVAMTRHRYEWDSNYDTTQIWMRLELWHDTDMNETGAMLSSQ